MSSEAMMRLTEMARILRDCKNEIADLHEKLSDLLKNESRIETEDMPELMRELDMKSFVLSDGTKIEVFDDLRCGITEANRPAAHSWLRANNFGGIIKTLVTQQWAAGETDMAMDAANRLSELTGRKAAVTENVHASTLKAFLKEQRAKGIKIPENLFGLFPFSKAKVSPPKG